MSSLLALFAALALGLTGPSGSAAHRTAVAPHGSAGSSGTSTVRGADPTTHRVVVKPLDVFGGPGM